MSAWRAKRFWKQATAEACDGGFTVRLDGRTVKTPAKRPLVVPTLAMAQAIAVEWDAQQGAVKPETMPVTRAANSALDKVAEQFDEVADLLIAYGGSDLLCYRATGPEGLVERQAAGWTPLLDWAAQDLSAPLTVTHGIVHVDAEGAIIEEIGLPAELSAHEIRYGFEGIAKVGDVLWMAVQRPWADDPENMVKLVSYNLTEQTWGAVHYPLETAAEGAWVGLSEITVKGDFAYLIERDNQVGALAKTKILTRVALADLKPGELGKELAVVKKELVRDLIPDLAMGNGYILDKVEGFAIDVAGNGYVVTDNDGVDNSSGETLFWTVGAVQ